MRDRILYRFLEAVQAALLKNNLEAISSQDP
jgi:hypothetical protein